MGFTVIDLPWGAKTPNRPGWQYERPTPDDLRVRFGRGPRNVAMLLGEASDNTVDADQDHPAWARVAEMYLPATWMRFGRPGKSGSHRPYRCAVLPKSEKFVDPIPVREGGMGTIGELRASSTQITVLPNSQHPSGEAMRWDELSARAEAKRQQER